MKWTQLAGKAEPDERFSAAVSLLFPHKPRTNRLHFAAPPLLVDTLGLRASTELVLKGFILVVCEARANDDRVLE